MSKVLNGDYLVQVKKFTGTVKQPFFKWTIDVPTYEATPYWSKVLPVEDDNVIFNGEKDPIFGNPGFTPDFVLPGSPAFSGNFMNNDRLTAVRQVTPGDKEWTTPQG